MKRVFLCCILLFPSFSKAWEPGTYPAQMHTSGFAVDRSDRNDVLSFWHAVYQASEGYENRVGWTGNFSGNNGTTSQVFQDDVERRLNYFRAMCGVSGDANIDRNSQVFIDPQDPHKPSPSTSKSSAAQSTALMLVRNYNPNTGNNPALTHNPPNNITGWSPAAWNGAARGNFAFGVYGPGAINEYMSERLSSSSATSSWVTLVGHRRWNLFPNATNYATGDQPGEGVNKPPTNIFYVIPNPSEISLNDGPAFVAYPPAGFYPASLNTPYWSLSAKDADFSNASVSVTDSNGNGISVANVRPSNGFGDPALIWDVSGAAASRSYNSDQTYQVSINGIRGANLRPSYTYSITFINPDVITSDQSIVGADSAPSGKSSAYRYTPPSRAEGIQIGAFKVESMRWVENGEKSVSGIGKTVVGPNYALRTKAKSFGGYAKVKGKRSFHLTFPNAYDPILRGVPSQSFELNREILTKPGARLVFKYRRGFMTKGSVLAVESSSDGGATWQKLGNDIRGVSDTQLKSNIARAVRDLPQSVNPLRVRFRYYRDNGAIFTHEATPKSPTGIFIDDIQTQNCDWLSLSKTTPVANTPASEKNATEFSFDAGTAGSTLTPGTQWQLRMQTRLGGKWFPFGPPKVITITP